jgi:hypothetical protein
MLFREFANDKSTADPAKLFALTQFFASRADDENAQAQISQDAFIDAAQSLGVNVTKDNLGTLISKAPLKNVLEPLDPNSGVVTFKGADIGPTAMPVNKAQDIVAAAAKSAAKKDRGV